MHVGDLVALEGGDGGAAQRQRGAGLVSLGPCVARLHDLAVEHLHEAVRARVVVDGAVREGRERRERRKGREGREGRGEKEGQG